MEPTDRKTIVPVPRYLLVRDSIMLELYQNAYGAGSFYATEDTLCERFQVGRNTVRHAIRELEEWGFLKRRRRVGVVVAKDGLAKYSMPQDGRKVILLLPNWSYHAGNFYERTVMRQLSTEHSFQVEMRLNHAPIPDDPAQLFAVIAVDPLLQHLPTLERLASQGVRIITVEAQSHFYMAANIQLDMRKAISEVVMEPRRLGHQQIGLIRQSGVHFTHLNWGDSFIRAMADQQLKFDPGLFVFSDSFEECPDHVFRRATAWLCAVWGDFERIAARVKALGLKIPEDVSIIAGDDHGDNVVDSIGTTLSVCRPDYVELSNLLCKLLEPEWHISPGSVLYSPVSFIRRGSVEKCNRKGISAS